jgi:hypothetical protein
VWKPVPGLEELYVASSLGRVARMVGHKSAGGYRHVNLPRKITPFKGHSMGASAKHSGNVRVYAHHLVALTFIGPPPDETRMQINHKDLDRSNNRPTNLEWTSQQENMEHFRRMRPGYAACNKPWKSSVDEWKKIRALHATGLTLPQISEQTSLSVSGVRWVLRSPKYREVA